MRKVTAGKESDSRVLLQAAAREARLAAGLPVEDEDETGGDGDGFGLDGAVRLAAPQISFAENVRPLSPLGRQSQLNFNWNGNQNFMFSDSSSSRSPHDSALHSPRDAIKSCSILLHS